MLDCHLVRSGERMRIILSDFGLLSVCVHIHARQGHQHRCKANGDSGFQVHHDFFKLYIGKNWVHNDCKRGVKKQRSQKGNRPIPAPELRTSVQVSFRKRMQAGASKFSKCRSIGHKQNTWQTNTAAFAASRICNVPAGWCARRSGLHSLVCVQKSMQMSRDD